jgi:membrane dipeptidase
VAEPLLVEGHAHVTNVAFVQRLDPWQPQPTGTIDFARAAAGGLNVVVDHLFVEDRYNDYNYAPKQALRLLSTFMDVLDANPGRMGLARTADEARDIVASGRLAVVLALEGGFDAEADLDLLRFFARQGIRMIQLTSHDTTNAVIDAYAGERRHGGLSDHGRRVIDEMNRLGIVGDISHATDVGKAQAIEASAAPVVTSHNGICHFADVTGNMSDELLLAMAAKGGLVGLHSAGWLISQRAADWNERQAARRAAAPAPAAPTRPAAYDGSAFIDALDREMATRWKERWGYGTPWRQRHDDALAAGAPLPTVEEWAHQAAWLVDLVGDAHVGLGLDLMAGGNWLRDFDATGYRLLPPALAAAGLSEERVARVSGENWLRILEAARA